MTDNRQNPSVDFYYDKEQKWQEEIKELRSIVLDCPLTEELKWGVPCYTYNKSNVVIIHFFKEYCALLFIKGALLHDPHNLLIQQTKNVQAGRQIRFTDVQKIVELENILKEYVNEAIEIEKSGIKVPVKKDTEFAIPEELENKFAEMPALKKAFEALTPGRQRAYLLFFSASKQSQTRVSRIEKSVPQILDGKGLND